MATKFLIVETNFAYNDEYYYPEEGTTPKVVYDNREDADAECARLNKAAKKTHDYIFEQYDEDNGWSELAGETPPQMYSVIEVESR